MSRRPIVTLTTDFGRADWYVGALHGAVLSACPEATVVDITHDVPPHDVEEGAFALLAATRAFPRGTVHVAVVDPGVGGDRRALAVRAGDDYFVGPDNGVLAPAIAERIEAGAAVEAVVIDPARVSAGRVSATFHGRDLFAPAAARLASGARVSELGAPLASPWAALDGWTASSDGAGGFRTRIIHVDRFGNAVTALRGSVAGPRIQWRAPDGRLVRPAAAYSAVNRGDPLLIIGGAGFVEIAAREAPASEMFALARGSIVHFESTRNENEGESA